MTDIPAAVQEVIQTFVSEAGKRVIHVQLAFLRQSPLYRDDPGRAYILMETLRIMNNNSPVRIGEREEALLIRDLMLEEEARVAMNAKVIRHVVVELYDSTKREIQAMLVGNTIGSTKCFSIVAEVWTASPINTKFLGLRLYLVDSSFMFKSVLLGTRHFAPQYGERDDVIRGPFYRWIGDVLGDFDLSRHDLFGATSDGGSDVKWMLKNGLNLRWERCVPHFTHAATKTAFGIVGDISASKNPTMTDMLRHIIKTVYQTQHIEGMGTLFSELCNIMNEEDVNAHQLLTSRTHRFLGLTHVRATKTQRENVVPPASFPLARDKMELIQVLSLLEPISMLNQIEQAESGNQRNMILGLYKL
ncbi:hypothetical protein BBJ28_00013305 [Nothophytophthora sp. Chile5]|nr:hypothetical protein BBJ28_00013305 [Nothophytophthora sp. Chile5]